MTYRCEKVTRRSYCWYLFVYIYNSSFFIFVSGKDSENTSTNCLPRFLSLFYRECNDIFNYSVVWVENYSPLLSVVLDFRTNCSCHPRCLSPALVVIRSVSVYFPSAYRFKSVQRSITPNPRFSSITISVFAQRSPEKKRSSSPCLF